VDRRSSTVGAVSGTLDRLELARFPIDPRDTLRAWDAADEYLLQHLGEPAAVPVIVNDNWGALATALAEHHPVQITDSHTAQSATRQNLSRNGIDADQVTLLSTADAAPSRIDLLIVRVPKSLALLEQELHDLAPALHKDSVVVGAGMTKDVHTSTLQLFERIVGPTTTSLAVKKARLIFATPDPEIVRPASTWPRTFVLPPDTGIAAGRRITHHAGVFSAERLDVGTRLLLQHLPGRPGARRIVDLGCGNGILGLAAALTNTDAELTFLDESYLAVTSARDTFQANLPDRTAQFVVADGLLSSGAVERGSVDLVLNNPPFHAQHSLTDATAWRMFADSKDALRPGGELLVVGNRHLCYHAKLKRLFGNYETVGSNAKFVVLRAVRR